MSALESMIASNPYGEAPIHPSLMYELPAPSTAIVDRKQHCRAYPSSASSLTLTGTRTVRIRLGGEDFVDPSSIRLMFTIKNETTGPLRPFTGPYGVWQQAYLRSNGVELDNIPHYNRFHHQYGFNQLSREDQIAVGNEGMGSSKLDEWTQYDVGEISVNQSLTVLHKLHFSLFSAGRLIPVKYAPLEIELTLVSDVKDWLTQEPNTSQVFSISDVQLLFDSYQLDEAVQQSFYSALLKNRVLSIPLMNVYQICHPLPNPSPTSYSFSSVRAFSRLAQIWLTFRATGPRAAQFMCPGSLPGESDATNTDMKNASVPQARLSIGPANWPMPQPTSGESAAELHYMLNKVLGYSPNITRKAFEEKCFTICFDLRRLPSDVTTAISTRSGDLVRVELTNMLPGAGATECWMTMVSFGVMAIRESGVTLLT